MKTKDDHCGNPAVGIVVYSVAACVCLLLLHPAVFQPGMMPFWSRVVAYITAGAAFGFFSVRIIMLARHALHKRGEIEDESTRN